jgi:hypothetical protein
MTSRGNKLVQVYSPSIHRDLGGLSDNVTDTEVLEGIQEDIWKYFKNSNKTAKKTKEMFIDTGFFHTPSAVDSFFGKIRDEPFISRLNERLSDGFKEGRIPTTMWDYRFLQAQTRITNLVAYYSNNLEEFMTVLGELPDYIPEFVLGSSLEYAPQPKEIDHF